VESRSVTRIGVVGGDRRALAAAAALAAEGCDVRATALPDAPGVRVVALEDALDSADAVLGPVQGMDQRGRVFALEGIERPALGERELRLTRPGATIFIGAADDGLKDAAARLGLRLVEYRDRDDFAVYNSIATAEGAIAIAMEQLDTTIFGSRCLVLGYGRCGRSLARRLLGLGATVEVAARRDASLASAYEAGCLPVPMRGLRDALARADVTFNTVPAVVVGRRELERAGRGLLIVDLASAPGGVDPAAAAEAGAHVVTAPGLPGRVAPVTSGRIISELVLRTLDDGSSRDGRLRREAGVGGR